MRPGQLRGITDNFIPKWRKQEGPGKLMRNRMLFGLASAMSTASTVGCLSKYYVAAAYDLTSMFVGVWWCVVQVIRHEENLQVRHLVFRHSGDSAICDFAIRVRFMLRLRIAILRFLL